jgi:hypothetical protein
MKLFKKMKDGGPESKVTGYWLIEAKKLFSVVLLHFENGSREAYHSHAFNSISWVLTGLLIEHRLYGASPSYTDQPWVKFYRPSLKPVFTSRENLHRVLSKDDTWVLSKDDTWVLSFRGPWADNWQEIVPEGWRWLTHGRQIVEGGPGRP